MSQEKLRRLRDELEGIEPFPWTAIEIWIARARPLLRQTYAVHLPDFEPVVREPRWLMLPRVLGKDSRSTDAREREFNTRVAREGKAKLIAFLDGLLDLDDAARTQPPEVQAVPPAGSPGQGGERAFEYEVALSFAGEDRAYVEEVARRLKEAGVSVFYDRFEEADLWGKDLYVHLDDVYRKKARYCVIFASRHYAEKAWPNHERQSAQARALNEKREYLLPARFDDTEIPGVRDTIGYIDLRARPPVQFASVILAKLGGAAPLVPDGATATTAATAATPGADASPSDVATALDAVLDRLEAQPGISVADWRLVDGLVHRLEPAETLVGLYRNEGQAMNALLRARDIARRTRERMAPKTPLKLLKDG